MSFNIRYFLEVFIGTKVLDITQSQPDDNDDEHGEFIELFFDNGGTLRVYARDSELGPTFSSQHPDDCTCQCCKDQEASANESPSVSP